MSAHATLQIKIAYEEESLSPEQQKYVRYVLHTAAMHLADNGLLGGESVDGPIVSEWGCQVILD